MGKPYSMDLRERVVAAIEGGESTHQAAARFSIGVATAGVWARLKRATGDVRPAKQGKPRGGGAGCARGVHLRCACRGT
jgi:transposase